MRTLQAKRWFHRSVCLALIPAMTGCTAALWTPALATQAVHPQIAGLVRNYPGKGDEALVVTYHAPGDGTDVNLVVPLDAARTPRYPFTPDGRAHAIRLSGSRDGVELAGFVDQKQLGALLASGKAIAGDRDALGRHFNAADWSPVGGDSLAWAGSKLEQQGTALVLAFQTDANGQVVPVAIDSKDQPDNKIVHEPYVHLLMVPASVDRPPGDQARDKAVAVVLTPVAVAGDAAGTGIVIGACGAVIGVAIPVVVFLAIVDRDAFNPPQSNDQTTAQPAAPPPPAELTVPIYFRDEKADQTAGGTSGRSPAAPAPGTDCQISIRK